MELTTTSATATSTNATSIAAFAAAVRTALDDLPADEADELVDGLEADLADQAADRGGDFVLGDPGAYADELRAAAGIPPRVESDRTPSRVRVWLTAGLRDAPRDAVAAVRRNRAGSWMLDLLISLRPVWWLARGWALYAMIVPWFDVYMLTPHPDVFRLTIGGVLALAAFLLLSIQWGRGRWQPGFWGRVVRVAVSVVTAIALPFLVVGTINSARFWQDYALTFEQSPTPGLAVDGERVRNIFAYDASGNPLEGVQLFDQSGRPLTTVGSRFVYDEMSWDEYFAGGGGPVTVPFTAPGRQPLWNVFPLNEVLDPQYEAVDPDTAVQPTFPFLLVPAVEGVQPTPTTTPTPVSSESPAPAETPVP